MICARCNTEITSRKTRGMCSACYQDVRRKDELAPYKSTCDLSLPERLQKFSKLNESTGCIEWTGTKSHGYGKFSFNSKPHIAHRVSWEISNGKKVPKGMFVCHHCDNPSCINPSHLFLGTPDDNTKDMLSKDRNKKGESAATKLKAADISMIRLDARTHRAIAASYGVSHRHIGNIKAHKVWASI